MRATAAIIGILGLLAASDSWADGTVNAVSYLPLPAGQPIYLRAMDNSDENMMLKKEFEDALTAKGYRIDKDATLVLTFETRREIGTGGSGGQRTVMEIEARGSSNHGGSGDPDEAKMRLNLVDTGRGGIFNQGPASGRGNPTQARIDLTLDDRQGKRRVWQGWATGEVESAGGFALNRAMIAPLVNSLGRTVRRESFPTP